ncbi:hypothetical protein ACFQGE_07460 [Halomicroarcula sp. GCM10025817]|uniref:hypothetical protein n=1 Tax=Haloarcula TaxID=2237 RepID=UPI0023E775B8|nr:hypothetical protein [Halomicroarcula sp. SYNS111]
MTDTIMWKHMQQYRTDWHKAKKTLEEIETLSVDEHTAHVNYHVQTRQWVARIAPLDSVEGIHQEIWHEQQFGEYTGLREALEEGLQTDSFRIEDPLAVDTLGEIGAAADKITVDAVGLPEQPPVDVEPWTPDPPEERRERLEEMFEETPGLSKDDVYGGEQ